MERLVDVVTPLGAALWFRQMTGAEALSSLFEFDITFHSKQSGLSAKAMLGKDITLKIETEGGKAVRHFNGLCTRFGSGGREGEHLLYTAKLRPWLWLASRRSDCKIFQFKKVPDIISDVLEKYGFELVLKLKKTYREWEYCVQYQETDLNFVMRLMENEGIYFYFEHVMGSHKLVLADDISCHSPLPGKRDIKYFGLAAAGVADEEHFNSWQVLEEVNSGEYITDDYDFQKPRGDLKTRRKNPMGHSHDAWERYMWPGGYTEFGDGENYSGARLESLEAEHERTEGNTTVRTMAPGYLFNLSRCPRADQNREYLSVATSYFFRDNARMSAGSGAGDATWRILVTAQPTTVPYRPPQATLKPLTSGPQTAVVVGPVGEEIYTDKYGRVKVQFFWDRYGKKDENSSCWVRVSYPWAGEKWGFIHIPRIGQEVIVDFIGGDPDYPMITGRVYNADQMPPYGLPDNKTASGIKSRSTKGGNATDFNEIRMEDSKGKEQLYVHAQRNLDTVIEADESRVVGNDRRTRIGHDDDRFVAHDDRHVINNNQSHQITANQDTTVGVNQTVTVGASQSVTVGASRGLTVGAAMSESIGANHSLDVGSRQAISVGGAQTVQVGANLSLTVGGGRNTLVSKDDSTVCAAKASYSAINYSVIAGKTYSETCFTRKALVMGTDETTIMAKQTETVGAAREVTVGGKDSLTVGGLKSVDVVGAYTVKAGAAVDVTAGLAMTLKSGAVVSISAAGAVTIAGATVMVTGGALTMMGAVTIVGPLTVAGPVTAVSIVSPTYSPGVGNMV
jgi:type VI secretion system secreted protein VgrG